MGYETRMYIGTPYLGGEEAYVQLEGDGSAHHIFNDKKDKKGDFFYINEVKQYVVDLKSKGMKYKLVNAEIMQIVAMVDLRKASVGEMAKVIDKGHDNENGKKGGYYDDTGNSVIVGDCYDDALTFVDPKKVLKAMKKEQKVHEYRRFIIAIATLEATIKYFEGEDLRVLFYSY